MQPQTALPRNQRRLARRKVRQLIQIHRENQRQDRRSKAILGIQQWYIFLPQGQRKGYPVWWGTAPRIIQAFLENSDISQAAVYTFCTSGGSGIEQSVEDLQGQYPDVNIVGGRRFGQGADADVKEWIEEHDVKQ